MPLVSHLFFCVVAALHQPVHDLSWRGLVLQVVDGACTAQRITTAGISSVLRKQLLLLPTQTIACLVLVTCLVSSAYAAAGAGGVVLHAVVLACCQQLAQEVLLLPCLWLCCAADGAGCPPYLFLGPCACPQHAQQAAQQEPAAATSQHSKKAAAQQRPLVKQSVLMHSKFAGSTVTQAVQQCRL